MSDIFQEVEEDVRRERYEQLWKQYGNYIIAAAVVLVLAAGAYQAWKTYDLRQRQQFSDRFQAAQQLVESGNVAAAEQQFATLSRDAPSGYATLAKFQLAGVYLAENKRDQGVALLRELAQNSDPLLADTARLRLAWALADAESKANVAAVLQPLLADNSPWRSAATEVLAYMDLKSGARSAAEAAYAKLAEDTTASPSLRQRAAAITQFLKANPDSLSLNAPPPTLPSAAPAPASPAPGAPAPASSAAQGTKPK